MEMRKQTERERERDGRRVTVVGKATILIRIIVPIVMLHYNDIDTHIHAHIYLCPGKGARGLENLRNL